MREHQTDVLVRDRRIFEQQYSGITVDQVSIEEILLLLVKGRNRMRGLLLNNYYSLQNTIKTSLGIALMLALVPLAVIDNSILNAIIGAQILVFVVSIGASPAGR